MSEAATAAAPSIEAPRMGQFERYLTLWVALCIVVGIALGGLIPGVFHLLGTAEVAQVNLPVAVLVWLMVIPMLLTKFEYDALARRRPLRVSVRFDRPSAITPSRIFVKTEVLEVIGCLQASSRI
jgi:uncharacterized membrane protein